MLGKYIKLVTLVCRYSCQSASTYYSPVQIHPISPQYNSIQSNLEITSDRILLALVIDEFHKLGGFLLSSAIPFDGISLYCGGQIYWSCVVQIHLKWESQNTILEKICFVSIHCLFQLRILGMTSSGQTYWFPLIWSHVAPQQFLVKIPTPVHRE